MLRFIKSKEYKQIQTRQWGTYLVLMIVPTDSESSDPGLYIKQREETVTNKMFVWIKHFITKEWACACHSLTQ